MNIGVLVIRILVGLLIAGHGAQKLFGWWGGQGLEASGEFFHVLGHRPGRRMATVAGLAEAGGGLFLALGLLTPLAAAAVMGTMIVAGSSRRASGLWNVDGGYELPLAYGSVALGLAFTGGGTLSLDAALGLGWGGWQWGVGMLVLAIVAGMNVQSRSVRTLRHEEAAATYPADMPDDLPAEAGEVTQRLQMP